VNALQKMILRILKDSKFPMTISEISSDKRMRKSELLKNKYNNYIGENHKAYKELVDQLVYLQIERSVSSKIRFSNKLDGSTIVEYFV